MILKALSEELKELLQEIEEQGFTLTLIGGAVRDRLLGLPMGEDLDFEIRSHENKDWEKQIESFRHFLKSKHLTIETLPYLITRAKYKSYDLEFSSPRKEKLLPGNKSHHHFEATCEAQMSYSDSFLRRDLTLNAIGIELDFKNQTEKIVDPYNGQQDIKNKILKHVSADFFADQVRFLRLVRFSIIFNNFQISEETKNGLHLFDLSELSSHHLKKEMMKSKHAGIFMNRVQELANDHKIKIRPVIGHNLFPESLMTLQQLVNYLVAIDEKKAVEWCMFFGLPEKLIKETKSFLQSWKTISHLTTEDIKNVQSEDLTKQRDLIVEFKNLFEKKDFSFLVPFLPPLPFEIQEFWAGKLPEITAGELDQTPIEVRSLLKIHRYLKTFI